jgi:phosphoribosylaminoimidazolecarboxamide formyltransferase/IMP cyclohydrolase
MSDLVPLRRALLSVHDKAGLEELGRALAARSVELVSTGGTARFLRGLGLEVTDVSELTGFPEMLDGRVKTLHPGVHGGLLALRGEPGHEAALREHGIRPIDLVVSSLYPFEQTISRPGVSREEAVEQIDIGGPSMVRSAAKNHAWVAVLTEPGQYPDLLEELEHHGGATTRDLRRRLARAAFARTSAYDAAIHRWFQEQEGQPLPQALGPCARRGVLRYGENPHQVAAFYADPLAPEGSLAKARVLGGKALSFNNYGDVDAAWALVRDLGEPACVIVKHANPCGVAVANSVREAYEAAVLCDPRSAFGGIVALNEPLTVDLADDMAVAERFFEVIIAPVIEEPAAQAFVAVGAPAWGRSLRLLEAGTAAGAPFGLDVRSVDGGLLVQTRDRDLYGSGCPRSVSARAPTPQEEADLDFAWRVVRHVRSNAIVLAKGGRAIGVGAGQMSRVEATEIAVARARRYCAETGEDLRGMVVASDAFYPFNDAIEVALDAGATAVVHPGGSRNDERAVALCDARGAALWVGGNRHFRH